MVLKQSGHKEALNNSLITEGNLKLLPLNKSNYSFINLVNKNMKKRMNNLRNKDVVNKPIERFKSRYECQNKSSCESIISNIF